MKKEFVRPLPFLKEASRVQIWLAPLWICVMGAAVAVGLVWIGREGFALLALGLTATLAFLTLQRNRRNWLAVAQTMDSQYSSKNRLEAATELADADDPIAIAQRADAGNWVQTIPRRKVSPLGVPLVLLLLLLIFGATLGVGRFIGFASSRVADPAGLPEVPPTATLTWITPASESKATKIEEVPLKAKVASSSGLKELKLEISVNGIPKASIPIPDAKVGEPGEYPIDISIYMDELEVEPLDVVSYNLVATRDWKEPLPVSSSELQFIVVRPFREDAVEMSGNGKSMIDLLLQLKVAQLGLLKQNFVLGHSELDRSSSVWKTENTRVAEEQKLLSQRTQEVVDLFISEGAPAEIIRLLSSARPPMDSAAMLIEKNENLNAANEQARALALITQCEKSIIRTVPRDGKGEPPPIKDPFEDEQKFELPPREDTAAGALEQAAEDQAELNEKIKEEAKKAAALDSPKGSGKKPGSQGGSPADDKGSGSEGKDGSGEGKGEGEGSGSGSGGKGKSGGGKSGEASASADLAKEQAEIAAALKALLNKSETPPELAEPLKNAIESAGETQKQLEAEDLPAANEPAERTLADLRKAVQAMKQAANENTEQALARAQRELNKGAEELRAAPQEDLKEAAKRAAEQSAKAQEAVANEARRQQELGSEEVARQLELLAGAFDQAKLLPDLKELVDGKTAEVSMPLEKMENLAGLLAGAQLRLREGKEGLAQTIAELDRAAANIPRLAEAGTGNDPDKESLAAEIQSDIQAAAQKAAAGGGSEAKEGAADVLSALTAGAFGSSRTLGGSGASEAGKKRAYTDLESTVKKLADLLRDDLENARRRETLLEFKPDDAPPEYREAVSVYFEELSRPSKPEGTPKSEP